MIIGVSSLGTGGVGKSTIALALAIELSRYDVTLLLESTGFLHKLLDCPHVSEIEHRVRMIGNLSIVGIDNTYVTLDEVRRWLTMCNTTIEHRVKRSVRYVVLDLPAIHDENIFTVLDVLFLVQRPCATLILELVKLVKGRPLIKSKIIPIFYIINFWPSDIKLNDEKKLKQFLGIDPRELKRLRNVIIIPELDIRKSEKSILTVAYYIVKKGYLRNIVEKLRMLE